MNNTLNFYENNADSFAKNTMNVDFESVRVRFLKHIPDEGKILDFGCGAGRDTKAFLDNGYQVEAVDGSEKLCEIASEFTGIKVKQMLFNELLADNVYDGIWACSSILHLREDELVDVFCRIICALKKGGCLYTSFKYGEFEGLRNERYFKDFTEETFDIFIDRFSEIEIIDEWISTDVRPDRRDEKWLNLILQKKINIEPGTVHKRHQSVSFRYHNC